MNEVAVKFGDEGGVEHEEYRAAGHARCMNCKHEWEATAPVGDVFFDCPECNTRKGVFRNPFAAPVGAKFWACICGSEYFYLTDQYTACANCGLHQDLK